MKHMNRITLSLLLLSSTLNFISCKKDDISSEKDKNTNIETPVENNSVLVIENNILKGITDKNITSLILPSEIKEIANNVFEGSNISEITLNEGIETIGDACFLNSKIKKINFPSTLKHIGKAAFQDCTLLEKADMSKTAIEILPEGIFFDSGLKEISLPSNLKEISNEAFCGTNNLQYIQISKSTVIIGNKAFYQSGLTEITLHNNFLIIDHMAFGNCTNLKNVNKASDSGKNEGVISSAAFYDCTSLTEATLPDNITTLEGYTFIGCEKLQKISLPQNLKSIGDQGLRTNYDVQTIIFKSSDIPEMHIIQENTTSVFPFVNNINEILVPKQSVEEYKNRLTSYASKIKGI